MYFHLHIHRAYQIIPLVAITEVSANFSMLNHLTAIQWRKVCLAPHNHQLEGLLLPLPFGRMQFSNVPEEAPLPLEAI